MKENPTILNEKEMKLLRDISLLFRESRFRETFGDLGGIIKKILVMSHFNSGEIGKTDFDFIDFEKIPDSWGNNFLGPLINYIRNKQTIEIYYHPFYEDKPYFIHVHPYLLKEYRFRWYLIGLNDQKKELRTYGLDRIWEIKKIDKPFIPMNFNAGEYFKNSYGIISPTGIPPRIKIEVKKPQAQYLITQPLHQSQNIELEDENKVLFTFHLHPTYEFKSMLMGLGSDAKIIEPISLKEEILRELNATLGNYLSD
jgi:predicted DNA-binding transcriptional regulator YafY